MQKSILMLCLFSALNVQAQESPKNSLSTSLVRYERNSTTINNYFQVKIFTGLEYQRIFNKWQLGLKYEHGLNKINDSPKNDYGDIYIKGFLQEDNVYLTSNYTFASLFSSKFTISTGLSLYYSKAYYFGLTLGGNINHTKRFDDNYSSYGISTQININYCPTQKLFISLQSSARFGKGHLYNISTFKSPRDEYAYILPELKIGVKF